jgi:hypothetical protein
MNNETSLKPGFSLPGHFVISSSDEDRGWVESDGAVTDTGSWHLRSER